jgi:hypothetical protein
MRRMKLLAGLLALTIGAPTLAAADPWKDESGNRHAYGAYDQRSERDLRRAYKQGRRDALREARRDDDRWRQGRGGVQLYDHEGRRRLDWENRRRDGDRVWRDDRDRDRVWRDDRDRDRYDYVDRRSRRSEFSPADIIIPLLTQ